MISIQKIFLAAIVLMIFVPASGFAQSNAATDRKNSPTTDRAAKVDARANAAATAQAEREANLAAKKEDLAAKKEEAAALREQKKTELFCERAEKNVAHIRSRITNGLTGMQNRYTEHRNKVAERKAEQFEKLAADRRMGDVRREEYYDTLVARATTDVQTEVIAAYEAAIEKAVVERRSRVDAALATFWDASQDAVVTHQEDYAKAYGAFEKEVETIATRAQEECTGTTVAQNRANNVTQELQGVQKAFRENQTLAQELREALSAHRATMQKEITKATDAYRAEVEAARAIMQEALQPTA